MLNVKAWETQSLKSLGVLLVGFGFDPKPKGQSFWKPINGGRASFHLGFIDHGDEFDVTADVAIRFDELEELVNADNKLLSKKQRADTYSLGTELGRLKGEAQKRWTVRREQDIEPAASAIFDEFKATAVPYLETYSSMERAYEVLVKDDKEGWLHNPIHGSRAKRAIGLPRILGKYEQLQEIIQLKDNFLSERKDAALADFRNFAKRIV